MADRQRFPIPFFDKTFVERWYLPLFRRPQTGLLNTRRDLGDRRGTQAFPRQEIRSVPRIPLYTGIFLVLDYAMLRSC